MKMKRALVLAVCFVCMWFGSALAVTQVQLDDDSTLYDLVERYNDLTKRINSDDFNGYMRERISDSFIRLNDTLIPYTTTYYSNNILTGTSIFASVNGNGLVSGVLIVVPNSQSSNVCAFAASRFIAILDSSLPYRDIQATCVRSLERQDSNMIYSVKHNRGYIVNGCNTDGYYRLAIIAGAQ
jgi:hypothetical protein